MTTTPTPPPTPADRVRAEEALAFIAHQIRPTWGRQGILAAIRKCAGRPLDLLAAAVIYAAVMRPDQHTPDLISRDGEHWQALDRMTGRVVGSQPAVTPADTCPYHRQALPCTECANYARSVLTNPDRIREIRNRYREGDNR